MIPRVLPALTFSDSVIIHGKPKGVGCLGRDYVLDGRVTRLCKLYDCGWIFRQAGLKVE